MKNTQSVKSKTLLSFVEEHLFVPAKNAIKSFFAKSESGAHQEYGDVILYNEEGKVLLLHRTYTDDFMNGTWGFPGGHVEKNENPTEGAQRELFEETGIAAACAFLKTKEIPGGTIHYFEARVSGLVDILLDAEEHRGYEWVEPSKIKEYNLIADLKDYVNDLLAITEPNVSPLEDNWNTIKIAFDNDMITADQFFKARDQYMRMKEQEEKEQQATQSLETLAKAFDAGLIDSNQYIQALEFYDQIIQKGRKKVEAAIGEKREFGGRMHIKTAEGWKYYGKGTGTKASEHASSAPKREEISKKKVFKLGRYELDLDSKRSAGGSGGAYIVDTNLGMIVLKEPFDHGAKNSPDQLGQEVLVDTLYRRMGINASASTIVEGDGGSTFKIAKFIHTAKDLGSLSSSAQEKANKEISKGFVLDCLLLNWDVIGEGQDNIVVDADGNVHRIDNGGALLYRAKKGEKPESALKREVTEIESMRSSKNPIARETFKSLTEEDIVNQVKDVIVNRELIMSTIDGASLSKDKKKKIADLIGSRIDWLQETYIAKGPTKTARPPHDYPSDATAAYFDKWDDVKMEGNPGIKDAIKKQIIEAEKNNEEYYREHAKTRGISVEEYKGLLQQHVELLLAKSDFFRATDIKVLDTILNESKRFKSQFETRTSHGSLDTDYRASVENTYFGFSTDKAVDASKRCIYGYFSDNENGVLNSIGEIPPPNKVAQYGTVTVKLKKDRVLHKTTVTFNDSLGYSHAMAATPASYPHFTSFKLSRSKDPLTRSSISASTEEYVETQYHNQLTIDDIDSVRISPFSTSYGGSADYTIINKVIDITRKTHLPIHIFDKK